MKSLIILLALMLCIFAAPKEPYSLNLDTNRIQTIPIHHEIDTLLIFPDEVETIVGKGLTSGTSAAGTVLYQQGEKNKKTIILRHLDNETTVLMTVIIKESAFVFRIVPSLEPASVIYLLEPGGLHEKARKVTAEEVLLKKRPLSEERKLELFRLSKEAHILKPQVPKFYVGFSEKGVSLTSTRGQVTTTIKRLIRFDNEDALLFFGTIHNGGNEPVDLAQRRVLLQVGNQRFYRPNRFRSDQRMIDPNSSVNFEGLLLGNGQDSPLHLSLDNQFHLHL